MSCPARVVDHQPNIIRHGSSFSGLQGLRRDFVSTIKTLAMLFLYLLMSSPLHISAAVHSQCQNLGTEICHKVNVFVIIFYHLSMLGLVLYPFMWLVLDRQFAQRICGLFRNKK